MSKENKVTHEQIMKKLMDVSTVRESMEKDYPKVKVKLDRIKEIIKNASPDGLTEEEYKEILKLEEETGISFRRIN